MGNEGSQFPDEGEQVDYGSSYGGASWDNRPPPLPQNHMSSNSGVTSGPISMQQASGFYPSTSTPPANPYKPQATLGNFSAPQATSINALHQPGFSNSFAPAQNPTSNIQPYKSLVNAGAVNRNASVSSISFPPSSAIGQSSASFGQSSASFGQSSTGFGQSSTGFGQSSTGFGQSSSGFGQSSVGFGSSLSGFSQSSSGFGQSSAGLGQTGSAYGQPFAGLGQPIGANSKQFSSSVTPVRRASSGNWDHDDTMFGPGDESTKRRQSAAAASSASTAAPPDIDLSHLSAIERAQIEAVMARAMQAQAAADAPR